MRSVLCVLFLILFMGGCAPVVPEVDRSADLDEFERGFLETDKSFSEENLLEAQQKFAVLKKQASKLSDPAFELAIAEIAALSENGHSSLYSAHWASAYNRLAVRFYIADDGLFIADARPGFENLIGARVETVAGHTLSDLRKVWDRYHTGTQGYRDQTLYYLIESPEMLYAAGLSINPDSVSLSIGEETVVIPTSNDWALPDGVWAILPQAREIELIRAGKIEGAPLYLQSPDSVYQVVNLPNFDAVYIQFRSNVDFTREIDLAAVADQTIIELQEAKPLYVVVDQRLNIGGDLNTTRNLMQALPDIVGADGHVFVITSGRTFSAGIASTAYLEQAGGDKVTIIGKPVGDHLEFWAEGELLELPQIGTFVGVATERHNYLTGCPEDDCHGPIQRHPIAIKSLEPDFSPQWSYEDVMAGEDPYLQAVFDRIDSLNAGND